MTTVYGVYPNERYQLVDVEQRYYPVFTSTSRGREGYEEVIRYAHAKLGCSLLRATHKGGYEVRTVQP